MSDAKSRRERARDHYAKNRDDILAKKSVWKRNNPYYLMRERMRIAGVRRSRRVSAIAILGGKCLHCGYADERALQFDHKTPVRRKSNTTRNHGGCLLPTEFRAIINRETHDIQLLCANCHAIKTADDRAARWMATEISSAASVQGILL